MAIIEILNGFSLFLEAQKEPGLMKRSPSYVFFLKKINGILKMTRVSFVFLSFCMKITFGHIKESKQLIGIAKENNFVCKYV